MKKIFTLFLFSVAAMTVNAQSNGYYRVQNVNYEKYLVMVDNQSAGLEGTSVDLGAFVMREFEDVNTNPGSVVYISSKGNSKYDLEAQGSGLGKLTGGIVYPTLLKQSDGTYIITGSYSGIQFYLQSKSSSIDVILGGNWQDTKKGRWNLLPIDTKNNYLGLKPDVKTDDGSYWGTFYASFPFKLASDGMEAYYVDGVNDYSFTLKKVSGTIAATMPVIIKCSSSDPAKNMIEPVESGGSEPNDNNIWGVYFDNSSKGHVNRKEFNSSTMRVIGTSGGKLAFVKASSDYLTDGKYLPHNKCYLEVKSSAQSTLSVSETLGIDAVEAEVPAGKEGIYTLTGQKIPDGVTPRPGIYIQNGKKIVIK